MRSLVILRGSPASGKSTFIKENNLRDWTISAMGRLINKILHLYTK